MDRADPAPEGDQPGAAELGSPSRAPLRVLGDQPVAHAPHGLDPLGTQLAPQVADIHIHHVGPRFEVVAPHAAEQLLPGQHLTGVAQERLGQGELPGREVDRPPADVHPAGAQVQRQVTNSQHGGLRDVPVTQAQPDPREQLVEPERFGHVVIRPALQPGDGVGRRAPRGEHDHRHPVAGRPQPVQHGEPVHAGQPDIKDDQVELPGHRVVIPGDAVGHHRRSEPVGPQALGDERGDT